MNLVGRIAFSFAIGMSSFASFQNISGSQLQDDQLKVVFDIVTKQQAKSANEEGTEGGLGITVTRFDYNKNTLMTVKSFLMKDFNCFSEPNISAKLKRNNQTIAISNAFLGYANESKDYVVKMLKKAIKIRDIDNKYDHIKLFKASYSGAGSCEFGRDGFVIINEKSNELIFAYSNWSA